MGLPRIRNRSAEPYPQWSTGGGIIQGGPFRQAVMVCRRASFVTWLILYFVQKFWLSGVFGPACTMRGRIWTWLVPELACRAFRSVLPDLWMPAVSMFCLPRIRI